MNYNLFTIIFLKYIFLFKYFKNVSFKIIKSDNVINLTSKMISCTHSLLIVTSSILYLTNNITLEMWENCSYLTRVYSIFDLLLIYIFRNNFKNELKETTFHHILLFIGTIYIKDYPIDIARALLSEISNFPLHYCWFLIHVNKKHTHKFKISSILLLFLFTIFRIANFSNLCFTTTLNYKNYGFILLPLYGVTILNYRWWVLLLNKFKKLIINKK